MLNKFRILKYILFFVHLSYSQNYIKGRVTDAEFIAIQNCNVVLKEHNTESIIQYTYTNEKGFYEIPFPETGSFDLIFSALGFEKKSQKIALENKAVDTTITVVLIPKVLELNEVIIESIKPIITKNDTIIFNAASFLQGNEQVVEDLLKKIPGLNIDSNGTIKVGNQEIEKVMVEGDDFFEKGYKILTKNMPVYSINKVELYQNYSNNKLLKNIENSTKVALNLILNEDSKRVWFGNAQVGSSFVSKNRYELRSNLMNFGKKNKYYFLNNLNNIGKDGTGDINHLIRPYQFDEPGSLGDDQTANTVLSLGFDTPNLKPKRVHFNKAKMGSLNSIFSLSNKTKIKTLGFINTEESDFFRSSYLSFLIGNTSFTNIENFTGKKTQSTGFGKIDLIYDISKTKMLEYTVKLNSTNEKNTSNLEFNTNVLNEKLNTNNPLFDQKIVFTNKYTENKVFILSGRYSNEKTPQNYTVNQFIFNDLFTEKATNTNQFSENKMQFAGIEAHLLEKKEKGDLLELKFGNQFRTDVLNTCFELLQGEKILSIPNGYQNTLTYITNDLYLSSKYRFKIKKITLLTQLEAHQLFNQFENLNNKSSQNPFYLVPKIGFDWKINTKNKISSSYLLNITNSGVLDVYSGYVQTGFRTFSKGIEEFNQFYSSSAIVNYIHGSWGDRLFANTSFLYSKNNDFFSTNSILTKNYLQTDKIVVKDRELISISTNIDCFLKPIKSNLKISLSGTTTNFKNSVNSSNLREVKNTNANYGFELRSGYSGFLNYHIGTKWDFNKVETTIKNSFTNNMSFLDVSFQFNDKFNVQVQSESYTFGNADKKNSKYYFLDIEARYVLKENKVSIFLSANNLLNTETFRNYNVTDTTISQTEYRLIPRYVLLKMEYRF